MKKMIVFALALLVGINVANATNFGQDPLAQEAFINSASSSTKAGSAVVENGYMVNNATKEIVEVTHTAGKYTTSAGEQLHLTSKGQEINRFFKTEKGAMNYADKLSNTGTSAGSNLPVKYNPSNVPATNSGSNLPVKYNPSNVPATTSGNKLPVPKNDNIIDAEWKPVEPVSTAGKITAGQVMQVGSGLLMEAGGLIMTRDAFMKEGEIGAMDVATGAAGGAMAMSGAAMALNAVPVVGQIGYGVAIGVGAALGGGLMLTRVSSQNDCVRTEVEPNVTYCCNVVDGNAALGNAINYPIGRAIHNNKFGYINYCGQKDIFGSGTYKTDQGTFKNDEWLDAELSWCEENGVSYDFPAKDAHYLPIATWKIENGGTVPCWKWRCVDPGMKWENNDCVPDPKAKNKPEDEQPDDKNPGASKKTCNDLYAGHPKRLACCKAGKTTKWTGDIDNGSCYCVVPETQQPDNSKSWNGAKCIAKSDIGGDCKYRFTKTVTCSKGTQVVIDTEILLDKEDLNGRTCAEFNKQFAGNSDMEQKLAEKYCPDKGQDKVDSDEQRRQNIEQINKSKSNLDAFFKKVDSDRSVWKNADGSFNATRLASDLTAGVVLGTVGGVVSGVLIKKSQVEKGFDALNCTVNGQKVADWGDEFSVGFRR